ncbi:hypothetical protein [Streptomyces sp. NPDC056291]|uniref:hypothetical protein n=1 Tax=Streptomyces sp. NPDC056291 TaxID=3345772 RepID=UPI0035DE37AB
MPNRIEIDGESYAICQGAWDEFSGWRDKAYRDAWVVELIEREVRKQVVADLQEKAARDWPGIGILLDDIIHVVRGGVDGERQ